MHRKDCGGQTLKNWDDSGLLCGNEVNKLVTKGNETRTLGLSGKCLGHIKLKG